MALDPGLGAGDGQCTGGLEHHARVLEHVLDRRADLVGVDQHHFVDQLTAQAERLLADFLHRDPVGKQAHVIELHAPAGLERARHGIGVVGLHADDLDAGAQVLEVGGDAGDQAAPAHRDEHRVDGAFALAQDFHADGALPRDHVRIVVGMHEREPEPALELHRVRVGLVEGIAVQHHFRAARRHGVHLDLRRRHRHHDHRAAAEFLRGERHALCVVAGAGGDDAARELRARQVDHLVVGAAQLEREHRLQVLALEQQPVVQSPGQRGRELQR